jgi:ABC-type multidrug transport system fused ATPase/permease subunit
MTCPRRLSIRTAYGHLLTRDRFLFIVGVVAACATGISWPAWGIPLCPSCRNLQEHSRNLRTLNETQSQIDTINEQLVDDLIVISYIFLVNSGVYGLSEGVRVWCFRHVGEAQVSRLKQLYFQAILRQEVAWHDDPDNGAAASRFVTHFESIRCLYDISLSLALAFLSKVVLGILLALIADWKLALILMSMLPVLAVLFSLRTTGSSERATASTCLRAGIQGVC